MKNRLIKSLLVLSSAFLFSSCGDSKDKVVNDMVDLIEDQAEAAVEGDAKKMEALQKESQELMKRAKAVGIDPSDPSSLSDDQRKKLEDAGKKAINDSIDKIQDSLLGN